MSTASAESTYVLHTAGPMLLGLQRCHLCGRVLSDESRITDPAHRPGRYRFTRGQQVLVMALDDEVTITGPVVNLKQLPKKTRTCTDLDTPTTEKSSR